MHTVTKAVIDRCEADRLLPSSSKAILKDDYGIEEEARMRGQSCDSQGTQQVSSEDYLILQAGHTLLFPSSPRGFSSPPYPCLPPSGLVCWFPDREESIL